MNKTIYNKLIKLEEQGAVEYDITHRGGTYGVRIDDALKIAGTTREELEAAGAHLPVRLGAFCNYLGGGVRGAVTGISVQDMLDHNVPEKVAKKLGALIEAAKVRYIELENGMNDEEDANGEPNWDAMATNAARKAGTVSAY